MKSSIFSRVIYLLLLFTAFTCSKDDNCDIIVCLNAGECNGSTCDCATGYTSGNCSEQITPTSIRITNIKVTRFPSRNLQGQTWDSNNGADIYVALGYKDDLIYEHSAFISNASPNQNYDFVPEVDLIITNPTDRYSLALFDDDGMDDNQFMGGVEFNPYTSSNKFPKTFAIDAGGTIGFEISVEYSF